MTETIRTDPGTAKPFPGLGEILVEPSKPSEPATLVFIPAKP
jgi:hypothetical protein